MPYQHDRFRGPETFRQYMFHHYEDDKRAACKKGIDDLGALLFDISTSAVTHKDCYIKKHGEPSYRNLKIRGKTFKEYVESDLAMVTDLLNLQHRTGDTSNYPVSYEKLWPNRAKVNPPAVKRLDHNARAQLMLLKPVVARSDASEQEKKPAPRRLSPSCCFPFIR